MKFIRTLLYKLDELVWSTDTSNMSIWQTRIVGAERIGYLAVRDLFFDGQLSLRAMQSTVWGITVWVNGQRLEPPLGTADFSGSWVSYSWQLSASSLKPGANTIEVVINRTLPQLQDARFAWDDLQLKDVVFWRE